MHVATAINMNLWKYVQCAIQNCPTRLQFTETLTNLQRIRLSITQTILTNACAFLSTDAAFQGSVVVFACAFLACDLCVAFAHSHTLSFLLVATGAANKYERGAWLMQIAVVKRQDAIGWTVIFHSCRSPMGGFGIAGKGWGGLLSTWRFKPRGFSSDILIYGMMWLSNLTGVPSVKSKTRCNFRAIVFNDYVLIEIHVLIQCEASLRVWLRAWGFLNSPPRRQSLSYHW